MEDCMIIHHHVEDIVVETLGFRIRVLGSAGRPSVYCHTTLLMGPSRLVGDEVKTWSVVDHLECNGSQGRRVPCASMQKASDP